MSEGKFSQPRLYRDEERQIEESFRQLTEDKNRHKKTYTVEQDISRTVQEISAQEVSLPEDTFHPFERTAKLDETVQAVPGQEYFRQVSSSHQQIPQNRPQQASAAQQGYSRQAYTAQSQQDYSRQAYTTQSQQHYSRQTYTTQPQQDYSRQTYSAQPRQNVSGQRTGYDLLPEDLDTFFEDRQRIPDPVYPTDPYPEEKPDFIDKLMNLGDFFRKHQTPMILGFCGIAVALIILFVSIFFTGDKQESYDDVIFPNVLIADINIGGMTKNEAIAALKNATSSTYSTQDMVIDLSGTEIRLSPADTKASLDVKAAVEAAYEYGRTGSKTQQEQAYQNALYNEHIIAALPYLQLDTNYIRNALTTYAEDTGSTLTQTSYGLEGSEPALSADKFNDKTPTQTLVIIMGTPGIGFDANAVYEKVLDAYSLHQFLVKVENVQSVTDPDPIDLEKIYKEFYIAPVNASVNLQSFETKPGSYGYEFDLEEARKLVEKAQPGEVLRIPMEYIAPDILDNEAFFKDTLGEYQTRSTGNDTRNKNLQLACEALNGTVLNPSESLSFSNLMNKVSNFQPAPEDSGQADTPWGGVSQVSSTLYYAALMSDLAISSRSNHGYLPSFIDHGLDATADLTILNNTGYPVRIDASYSGGYVKIKIAGTEERNYYVMLESSIANSTAPTVIYEDYAYDNEKGYEDGDVIEEGSNGYLVKSYKIKYDRKTGKELSRDFITNSQYNAVDRVIARVEAPPETEAPTEAPIERPTEWPTDWPGFSSTETTPSDPYETESNDDFHHSGSWPEFTFGPSWQG